MEKQKKVLIYLFLFFIQNLFTLFKIQMIADNAKTFNNATLNYDLKFTSKIQNNKLIINALTKDDKFEYLGDFAN